MHRIACDMTHMRAREISSYLARRHGRGPRGFEVTVTQWTHLDLLPLIGGNLSSLFIFYQIHVLDVFLGVEGRGESVRYSTASRLASALLAYIVAMITA